MPPDDVPAGWKATTLGRVTVERTERVGAQISRPTVLSSTKHFGLVRSDDYFRNRMIYSADLALYKRVDRDWFAYATNHLSEGSIGLQETYDEACVSPIYTVFSAGADVDPRFLYRVLKSPALLARYRIGEQASVDRRGAVRYGDFAELGVRLPPLDEQRRIVALLDAADTAIHSAQRLVAKLGHARQGLLHDFFGIVGIVAGRVGGNAAGQANSRAGVWAGAVREPGGNAPEAGSEVGWSEVGSEVGSVRPVRPLADVADIAGGVTLGRVPPAGSSVALPYLRVANVQDGFIDCADVRTISVSRAEVGRYLLRRGDVLMTEGGDFDKLGRGAVWDGSIDPCLHQNHVFRVRCDPAVLLPEYLAAYSGSAAGRRYFVNSSKQTTNLASVNKSQLSAFPVPLPPVAEQRRIVDVLEHDVRRTRSAQAELVKLREARKGLTDDLLTGRVRLAT
jgi:type I restriction enzyme S subunit